MLLNNERKKFSLLNRIFHAFLISDSIKAPRLLFECSRNRLKCFMIEKFFWLINVQVFKCKVRVGSRHMTTTIGKLLSSDDKRIIDVFEKSE